MNKKGYTLIELIAIIVIIAILFSIAIASYTYFIKKTNEKVYESYRDGMYDAAQTYVMDHPLVNGLDEATITLEMLIADNKIDYIKNPKDSNDKCLGSYIQAKRRDVNGVINYEYNVCLVCNDYNEETQKNDSCEWKMISDSYVLKNNCSERPQNPSNGNFYNDCYEYKGFSFIAHDACCEGMFDPINNTWEPCAYYEVTDSEPEDHQIFLGTFQEANDVCHSQLKCGASSCIVGEFYKAKKYKYTCNTDTTPNNCKTYPN